MSSTTSKSTINQSRGAHGRGAASRTKVYLLQNRANSFFAVGELELTDGALRCRVTGNSGWTGT
jgi:hypothetical protein